MVIRIYVKMTKLVDVYTTAGVVKDQCTMCDFFRGFSEVHPLVEAIDAGDPIKKGRIPKSNVRKSDAVDPNVVEAIQLKLTYNPLK